MKTAIRLKVILILVLLCSCRTGDGRFDVSLQQAENAISTSPRDAMAMLDSINPDELSESRRHYYDLLTIMARDKAYITHTSDSLILDVVDYYSSRKSDPLYPKALYLGGRVYSDLGDYPTALNYFHKSLDAVPDDDEYLHFKACASSQTARLLHALRLYEQAIPYVEQSIAIGTSINDTFGIAYDYQLLGSLYLKTKDIDRAIYNFKEAVKYASQLSKTDSANMEVFHAVALHEIGQKDSVWKMIRSLLPIIVDKPTRNYALSVATDLYYEAGVYDTAYMYARELAMSPVKHNRQHGFNMLFADKVRRFIPEDSLYSYAMQYHEFVDGYLDSRESEAIIHQNSVYNYSIHEREKNEAIKGKYRMWIGFLLIVVVAVVLAIVIAVMRMKSYKRTLQLRDSFDKIRTLNEKLAYQNAIKDIPEPNLLSLESDDSVEIINNIIDNSVEKCLKKEILDNIQKLKYDKKDFPLSQTISESSVYEKLNDMLAHGSGIYEYQEQLWNDLEQLICAVSPNFRSQLMILTDNRMTVTDYQLALLMRCRFTITQIATLLNRSKNTISTRRISLSQKIFGKGGNAKSADNLIDIL